MGWTSRAREHYLLGRLKKERKKERKNQWIHQRIIWVMKPQVNERKQWSLGVDLLGAMQIKGTEQPLELLRLMCRGCTPVRGMSIVRCSWLVGQLRDANTLSTLE